MHQCINEVSFEGRNGGTLVEANACPVAVTGYLPFDALESRLASR